MYVLREFAAVLACCIAGFLTLFLITSLFDDIEDFFKFHAPVGDIVRYFLLLQPAQLVHVLPMSILLAAMYTMADLCRHNELTALAASGVSLVRLSLPIWLLAGLLTVVQLIVTEQAAPKARAAALAILRHAEDPYGKRARQRPHYLAFHEAEQGRNWLFEDFAVDRPCRGITISRFRADGTLEWELRADAGEYLNGFWVFRNAVIRRFDAEGLQTVGADECHAVYRCPDLTEGPRMFLYSFRLKPAGEMNILDLHRVLTRQRGKLAATTATVMRAYFYNRCLFPLSCLVAVLLGVPLAVTRERGTPIKSFILAAGLMAAYYSSTQLFLLLGKGGVMPPAVAAAVPFAVFAGWGIYELHRKR